MLRPERVVGHTDRAATCAAARAAAAVCSRSAATSADVRDRVHMCCVQSSIAAPWLSHPELSREPAACGWQ